MSLVWVGIGSNVGQRQDFCRRAVDELKNSSQVQVEEVSSLYETTPVGGPPQRSFINLVARLSTDLQPRDLLDLTQSIERRLGREADLVRWGPRVIDLDLLVVEGVSISEEDLEIPHPRLTERRFALVPLLEVDPDLRDPSGEPYAAYLGDATGEVIRLGDF